MDRWNGKLRYIKLETQPEGARVRSAQWAPSQMRIGTWNLAGRWDARHERLMRDQACDVWLVTEVSERLSLDGHLIHRTQASMAPGRRWAAVLSRESMAGLADPHPASALATVGNLTFCSSVLSWRSCPRNPPWVGSRHADMTKAALDDLMAVLPRTGLVWGGDWNHSLEGPDYSGSKEGLRHVQGAVAGLGLQVPTAALPHRLPSLASIDHIAVPRGLAVTAKGRVAASAAGRRLSDHDLYWVEIP